MPNVREPWERMEGETDLAFARFRTYLSLDVPRSRQDAADAINCGVSAVNHMAAKHSWPTRARAYDDRMAARAVEAAMTTHEEMHRRHAEGLKTLFYKGVAVVEQGLAIDARDGTAMITGAVKLERLIAGEATDRTESQVSSLDREPDLSRLTPDEREEWLALEDDPKMMRWVELDDKARGRGRESL